MMMMYMLMFYLLIINFNFKIYKMINQILLFLLTFMMIKNINFNFFIWIMIYYNMGMDNISFILIILTMWILNLALMSNIKFFNSTKLKFYNIIMSLLILFILCFSSINITYFYIFFETSLIPMMILILGWGTQIDRIQASMYMLFYTLFGSLPFFLMIIYMYKIINNTSFTFMMMMNNSINFNNFIIYMMMMIAFMIKLPLYYTHIWLPKAHVQAPISGSMILAGIMLKLGSYGIYRMINIFTYLNMKFSFIFIIISIIGSLYASINCLNKIDMKMIVAYSSIVHMNLMLSSLLTLNNWSYKGSLWMMIAHGLTSSAMFCLVNFNYERLKSRNLMINKGLINIFPSMTIWWFLMSASNFSAPPSLNLFSEMFMINGLMMFNKFNLILIFLITFFSTCYSIFLFSFSQQGMLIKLNKMKNMKINEFLIIILHWIPLNTIFIKMFFI